MSEFDRNARGMQNHELIISMLQKLDERMDAFDERLEHLEKLHNKIIGALYVLGVLFVSIAPLVWWFISKALPALERGVKQ